MIGIKYQMDALRLTSCIDDVISLFIHIVFLNNVLFPCMTKFPNQNNVIFCKIYQNTADIKESILYIQGNRENESDLLNLQISKEAPPPLLKNRFFEKV